MKRTTDAVEVIEEVQAGALSVYQHKVPGHQQFLVFESTNQVVLDEFEELLERVDFAGVSGVADIHALQKIRERFGYPYTPQDTRLIYKDKLWIVHPGKLFDEEFDRARLENLQSRLAGRGVQLSEDELRRMLEN